jgi:hypothetical protein
MNFKRKEYKLSEITFRNTTTFDEVEPLYHQVCKGINSASKDNNCSPHFVSTLIYLVLPANVRNSAIIDIYSIIIERNLYKETMDTLLENVEINEILQKKYNIDSVNLLRFTKRQKEILYAKFYESLYEISIDNHMRLK